MTALVYAVYVIGVPTVSDFTTTAGAGAPLCIDQTTGIVYYLAPGNIVKPILSRVPIIPQQFGAVGDDTTDDSAAFVAAIAYLKSIRTQPNSGYGSGSAELFVPAAAYFLGSTTLDITHTMHFRGEGGGAGGGATVLRWNVGTTGIRIQNFNTTGATEIIAPSPVDITSGRGSIIEGLLLKGSYAGVESEAYGIQLRADATIRDCSIYDFAGDGINVHATAGGGVGSEGNDNNARFEDLLIQNCRNGLFIDGADTNICNAVSLQTIGNRGYGVWDSSFLGNKHTAHQTAGNGAVAGTHPPCWVSQGGNRYVVKRGQEVGASTNPPSSTTADNTWWYYFGAGGPDSTIHCPAWVSGTTYRAGGSFCTDDSGNANNTFDGCYHEGSQPFAQFVSPTLVVGGSIRPNVRGVAVLYGGGTGGVASDGAFTAATSLNGQGSIHEFGSDSGADLEIDLRGGATEVGLWAWLIGVLKGYIRNINGVWHISGVFGIHLKFNGTDAVILDSTGQIYQNGFNPTLTEIAAASVPTPGAGTQTTFIDSADHKLKRKDSTGTVTIIA